MAPLAELLATSDPWRRLGYAHAEWLRVLAPPHREREAEVAEVAGEIAGIALVRPRFLAGDYLELIAVAPDLRGSGVGRALLAHVERRTFARAQNLFVCVSDFNQSARHFYAAAGYAEVGPLRELLVPWSDEILLRKTRGPTRGARNPT